ncbi:tripartite motif-containing protein 59 [Clarias gariepinus]
MDNLEEDLTCSICYSLFNDPRVLPCSHTFCKACLDNVLKVSTNFSVWRPLRLPLKCPNCRNLVELPPTGVEALPINVCLRAIIEKYQHDNEPRAPSCPEHHRQPLNVYCVQDCKLICGLCLTIGQHQGHKIDDIHMAYVKEQNSRAELVELLTNKHWEEVCDLMEKLEQEKFRHESVIRQEHKAVTQFFQGLELLLEQKKEAFMKVLDEASGQLACTYNPLIEKLKEMKEEQLELISSISSISEDESDIIFLERMHHFRKRVDALTQAELPEVPTPNIPPCLEEFLKERWSNVTIGSLEDGPVPTFSCQVQKHSIKEPQPAISHKRAFKFFLTVVSSLIAVLFFLLFWLNPLNEASPVFSNLSQIGQAVLSSVREISLPLHDSGTFLYRLFNNIYDIFQH